RFTVARGTSNGPTWSRSVNVKTYAKLGVGLYKVIGVGGPCSGAALVKVTGKSPLTTVAGIAGVALTALGGVGVVISALRAVRLPANKLGRFISFMSLPAMFAVGTGVAAPPVGFRPRISIFGIISGAIGGLGVGLLLQEYAVIYPTRNSALAVIVAGVLVNLL